MDLPVHLAEVVVCVDVLGRVFDGLQEVVFGSLEFGHQRADVVVAASIRWPQPQCFAVVRNGSLRLG